MRLKQLFCLLLCIVFCFGTVGCNSCKGESDDGGDSLVGNISFNRENWTLKDGDWEFSERMIEQKSDKKENRVVCKQEIDQTWMVLEYQTRAQSETAVSALEFRTSTDYSEQSLFRLQSRVVLDFENQRAGIEIPEMTYRAPYTVPANLKMGKWYTVKVELNGSNGRFFLDGELIADRADISYQSLLPITDDAYTGEQNKIALVAKGNVQYRRLEADTSVPDCVPYKEVIAQSNIVKKGYNRYASKVFEYPYYGLGRTSVFAGPNGFLYPDAPKSPKTADHYRFEPMLIYDYWWIGQRKVDPFAFRGGYLVGEKIDDGEFTKEEDCYEQILDVSSGLLKTNLNLSVDGTTVSTQRDSFVLADGTVVLKVVSDTDKSFAFEITKSKNVYTGVNRCEQTEHGLLFSSDLKDTDGNPKQAWLYLTYASEAGATVQAEQNRIVFEATEKPVYLFMTPASDLDPEEDGAARKNAIQRGERAKQSGWETLFSETKAWWESMYARSEISIPDLGMAKWYVRSLYYNAVSMAFTRVPPGCYATNVDAFLGQPCYEFDLMYSQLALMTANQTDISATTIDWIERILDKSRELAMNGADREGMKYCNAPGEAFLFTSLMAYDGTPVDTPGLFNSWRSTWCGTTVAQSMLMQAEYTDDARLRDLALRVTEGQGRLHLSHFMDHPTYKEAGLLHPSVAAPGDLSQNAAAIWTIETLQKYGKNVPFYDSLGREVDVNNIILRKKDANGNLYGTVYDERIGGTVVANNSQAMPGSVRNNVTGPVVSSVFNWLPIFTEKDSLALPTLVNMTECGHLDYNFNRGWVSTVADRFRCGDIAYELLQSFLSANVINDDSYFCENIHDIEDFERTPELGAHSALMMGVQDMMLQATDSKDLWVFPALPSAFEKHGCSFDTLLGFGNIEVSGEYSQEGTEVTVQNNGKHSAKRTMYVRVKSGSTVAVCNGTEYPVTEGQFAKIDLEIPAGEAAEFRLEGKTTAAPSAFEIRMPSPDSTALRNENVVFAWTASNGAQSYKLIISRNEDLSEPVFSEDVGNTVMYYSTTEILLRLKADTRYYYKVQAVNSAGTTDFASGIGTFRTYSKDESAFPIG